MPVALCAIVHSHLSVASLCLSVHDRFKWRSVFSCHLSPPLSSPTPTSLLLPQRKPAIQSGLEIKSIGAWPGRRPLTNEVGERQPKSLPLGLYCLYRGLVIGGYGSGIKRLLPQPLRRVRHSLPPAPLLPFIPLSYPFFSRETEKSAPSRARS